MGYFLSIANEKGGVAKTTTTLSLGASLAETGARVLLVDLDAQANLSLALGLEPGKIKQTVAHLLIDNLPAGQLCQDTAYDNLRLIPANAELTMLERLLPMRLKYETILRDALAPVADRYDYILLDCPPFLGAVTLAAITASNLLLIPTQPEFFSVYALRGMINVLRRIRAQHNPRLSYRLLLTMNDRRNRTHRALQEQLRATFGSGVLTTVIDVDTKLRESPISGQPILTHAPRSRAAAQYRALAQEMMSYVEENTAQPA